MGFRVACVGGFADVVGGVGEDGVDEAAFGWWVAYGAEGVVLVHGRRIRNISENSENFRSFSAVSAPIFASKYTFCSIFQNLPNHLADFFFENWQNLKFCKFCNICKMLLNFHENC